MLPLPGVHRQSSRALRGSQGGSATAPTVRSGAPAWLREGPAVHWLARSRAAQRFAGPQVQFWCDTEDGIRIAGTLLGPAGAPAAIVLAHGFLGYRTKPKMRILGEGLAGRFAVFTFDLRGHGGSGGLCTAGDREALDVDAVVRAARGRGFHRIVTVGGSLGGIAVLRQAALYGDVDAVVAISTPARWGGATKAVRRTSWLLTTSIGRELARRMGGVRIATSWSDPPPPGEIVGGISPTPLLIVHGDDDHFFPVEEAEILHERAGEPKRLWRIPGFGHAEDGYTAAFARRLGDEIDALLNIQTGR